MSANRVPSLTPCRSLALALAWLATAPQHHGAESVVPTAPRITTNYVRVTNIVVVTVTNYVVVTNLVLSTNQPPGSPTNSALPDLSWVPPEDKFDWIQLKSGEWLKGRVKAIQYRELDFESDEMDDQTFDWKDIRQLRSPRPLDVLVVNGEVATGPVAITPTDIVVGGATPRRFPRSQLQSLTAGGTRRLDYWSGDVSVGLTMRSGNTEQLDYIAGASLKRRTAVTRLSLDYTGSFSSTEGKETANNHRLTAEFDRWLSPRFYLVIPYLEYYRDPFQNLDHRLTGSVGVGYDLIYKPKLKWSITAGPAYQYSWFASSQPGEPTEKGAGALTFSSSFEWDITRSIELTLDYRGQYTSREVGETTHHSESTLSLDITKRLELDVSFIWDRTANPKIGADGVQPKPDDFRLVVGLSIEF